MEYSTKQDIGVVWSSRFSAHSKQPLPATYMVLHMDITATRLTNEFRLEEMVKEHTNSEDKESKKWLLAEAQEVAQTQREAKTQAEIRIKHRQLNAVFQITRKDRGV